MGRDGRHFEARALYGAPISASERQRRDDEFAQMTGEMRGHACARLESVLAACVRHCGGLAAALRRMRRVDVRGDDGDAVELDGAEVWRGGWALDGTSLVWRETYAHGCPEDVSAGWIAEDGAAADGQSAPPAAR